MSAGEEPLKQLRAALEECASGMDDPAKAYALFYGRVHQILKTHEREDHDDSAPPPPDPPSDR